MTDLFCKMCVAQGLPRPQAEYRFHPARKWRLDWAFERDGKKVALEMEGVSKTGASRHQAIGGFLKDMEKYNEAALAGWLVLRCTVRQFETGEVFALLKRAFE